MLCQESFVYSVSGIFVSYMCVLQGSVGVQVTSRLPSQRSPGLAAWRQQCRELDAEQPATWEDTNTRHREPGAGQKRLLGN